MYNNPPKTLFVGQKLLFLPECHSTNDIAADLINTASTPEGTVVITSQQTRGRGQRGNSWHTEPGKNLTLSITLKPTFLTANQQFLLNIAVSLAIHEFLSKYLPQNLSIKWPNDIYWKSQKMGGILIENTIQGLSLTHSIVGIGLNINQKSFPEQPRAISLKLASQPFIKEDEYDLEILLSELLIVFEKFYLLLRNGKTDSLRAYYLRNLYGYGEKRFFVSDGNRFEGTITGVDSQGRLVLEKDNKLCYFLFKEIEFVF
ncbi:biotin--[acetyl-CoA-carboxylase] ligase [Cytophagaceae bacterium YF14B1]|uniref:Biotin--[acetyl-CoA-carboxylase] ligase n=1 Tax=Xanthocytophaga flava TaxID=3048013 RepID=A0AAE3QXM6_9BACT|nr:biotin--[acetyl-CoA-carboxylase] ligase [Xanthocytophaga flavus]MDJ1484373.1 biotin--[acetyl-CoA-carboxylase] ligase [Xanthocytophaga flavus]